MAESNQEKFNYYVGVIFAALLDEFPRRTQLNLATLAGAEKCEETYIGGRYTARYIRNGEVEDVKDEMDFIYETAYWLFETGYLIGSVAMTKLGRSVFVTLSPKALEVLKIIPASIDSTPAVKSIGQEISDAVKASAKKQVGELASQALTYAIKFGWNVVTQS